MELFQVKMKWLQVVVFLFVHTALGTQAWDTKYFVDSASFSDLQPHTVTIDHIRHKRDTPHDFTHSNGASPTVPSPEAPSPNSTLTIPAASGSALPSPAEASPVASSSTPEGPKTPEHVNATASPTHTSGNSTNDSNRTQLPSSTPPSAAVTQVPILGANGTGQRWTNLTETTTKVSDPISADDSFADFFETPERIQADRHINNLTFDNHDFYNSTFIGDKQYFNEYWTNITKPTSNVHTMLSNSHRRATTVTLSFPFPFYGNWIQNITIATGGFIYTGEHTHAWLAATQYIAPLMANFDTSLNNDSVVKLADDGEKFTVFWENVTLHEDPKKQFTFAVTLYKNGDIVFAYKNIPILIENIDDTAHPVKIGISDAYLSDKIIFYVRRKTIYEYHRVSFKHYEISNNTILRLVALPTCLQYNSCDTCLQHNTGFDCAWCETIQKCSSGTDRNKQDWQLRNCDKTLVTNVSSCPVNVDAATVAPRPAPAKPQDTVTTYETDSHGNPYHDAVVKTLTTSEKSVVSGSTPTNTLPVSQESFHHEVKTHSTLGGVVAAFIAIALVCSLAAWILYAFKNPHTRSGQILIKYRPSQWNWRRGEARYTAATIHM